MSFHLEYLFAAVLFVECFGGFLVNVIILAAIFMKWKAQRSLQTYNEILSCLVTSRGLQLLSIFLLCITFVFYPWALQDMDFMVAISIETMLLNCACLWFATVLCVFYCVKIMSYNNRCLSFLKTKINTLVPWFLLASVLISLSTSLPFGFFAFDLESENVTNGTMENMTVHNHEPVTNLPNQFLILLLGSYPPFLIFCVSICLLLHSLWMHTRRMRSFGSTFRSPNLESHFSAVKSMSFFLVLQIIYFIVINIFLLCSLHYQEVWRIFSLIILCSPSFLHSVYIISTNSDLKKTCISMFHTLTRNDCC